MRKKQFLAQIQHLDAQRDHLEIARLVVYHDFTWDTVRSLEFALFRTFAVPSIGNLLLKTGEFTRRTQKRYDDTDLILGEIIENGYDSERGKTALRRMNRMHTRYDISNDDMRYVLSTFVLEPYRWNRRFGYRISTEKELEAAHALWYEIGKRMGIQDIPPTFREMEQFNIAYENSHFAYSEGGRQVADATLNLFLSWYLPPFLWKVGRPFVLALADEPLLQALKYPKPSRLVGGLVQLVMAIRKPILACIPLPKKPVLRTKRHVKTYPEGYEIEELGVNIPEKPF